MQNEVTPGGSRAHRPHHSPLITHRPAFSLAELMIAIVILGLGLLVAAAMFPIAWGKARELSEHTTAVDTAHAAEMTVGLIARVDSAASQLNFSSFAGAYLVETDSGNNDPRPILPSDTWVHPLAAENLLFGLPSNPNESPVIWEDAWRLPLDLRADAGTDHGYVPNVLFYPMLGPDVDPTTDPLAGQGWYKRPQVMIHDRVFPTMPPWPGGTATAAELDRWRARMDSRRHAWAVLHRLNEHIPHPNPAQPDYQQQRLERARRPRVFTTYYVTLRRGAGQRFARQDEAAFATGTVKALEPGAPGLPAGINSPDVQIPSPWLVPLITPSPLTASRALNFRDVAAEAVRLGVPITDPAVVDVPPRGVPTEVTVTLSTSVPPGGNATDEDHREFFPTGAQFIDHVNGQVYRVAKARFDDAAAAGPTVVLTLDREIFVEDLRDPMPKDPLNLPYGEQEPDVDFTYNTNPALRQVWVFPPAAEARGGPGAPLVVEGGSPVVDISVRPLTVYPQ